MLRAFIEWLYELFAPPCPHQWEKLAELKDREEGATAATIVRMCKHCGTVNEVTFRAPKGQGCPPHRWETVQMVDVWSSDYKTPESRANGLPKGKAVIQQCEVCGEMQRTNL